MATLRILALGPVGIFCDHAALHFPTKKAQDLLCFLVLHAGNPLERDMVAEHLWPLRSQGRARRCLSTTLWRLRKQTEGADDFFLKSYIQADQSTLAFNSSAPYWFDAAVFEEQATAGLAGTLPLSRSHFKALENAVALYRGDFLEDCYDNWCLVEQERLQLLLLWALRRLQCHYRLTEAFQTAIACGHRLLAIDPLQESVHRELIRSHVEAGQRSLALQQFQRCKEILSSELGIEPMAETRRLFQRIQSGHVPTRPQGTQPDDPTLPKAPAAQLRTAFETLESAWQSLQAAATKVIEASESTEDGALYPRSE